jgi:hypothetical protein
MTARKARTKKRAWPDTYLIELEKCGSLTAAAKAAGVNPKTAYRRRQADQEFADAVDELRYTTVEQVEDTLYQMASSGKDTTATIFFLKTRKPEVYGDKLRADQLEQIKREARQEVLAEMQREVSTLAPAARKLLMNAIPSAG